MYGLRFDTSFKYVFCDNHFLQQFMKDIFHEEIKKITYIDKEVFKENKHLSYSIFDLLIKEGVDLSFIKKVTGLTKTEILKISKNIDSL